MFLSDNGTHVKNDEVKFSQEQLKLNIKLQYIIEASPCWGDLWERLVQTVKRILRKILGRATVNYGGLVTIIAEAEGMKNSKSFGYMYTNDVAKILIPSSLNIR